MTKKDFKVFAQVIKEEREEIEKLANNPDAKITSAEIQGMAYELRAIERRIIEVLKQDNPRFSEQKFLNYIDGK